MSQQHWNNEASDPVTVPLDWTLYPKSDGFYAKKSDGTVVGPFVPAFDLHQVNYLINGSFLFAQRQTPGTLTTYAVNTYSADRWKTWAENASYQYQRMDGLSESGLTSQYFGSFKKITSAGKMMHFQIVEGLNSVALRGKKVIFQIKLKASSAKTIRMGIFELQNAGTIDSVPAILVSIASGNSVDPTMATNVAIIGSAESKSVTTAMQQFFVTATIPATSKNLICAVWTDSQFAANDILYIAEAGLYVGSAVQAWKPRLVSEERNMCQRYCYVTPDGSSVFGEVSGSWGTAATTSQASILMQYPVEMRIAPNGWTYSGNFRIDDGASSHAVTSLSTPGFASTQRETVYALVAGTPLTAGRPYKLSANNDATAKIIFSAEL